MSDTMMQPRVYWRNLASTFWPDLQQPPILPGLASEDDAERREMLFKIRELYAHAKESPVHTAIWYALVPWGGSSRNHRIYLRTMLDDATLVRHVLLSYPGNPLASGYVLIGGDKSPALSVLGSHKGLRRLKGDISRVLGADVKVRARKITAKQGERDIGVSDLLRQCATPEAP